MSKRYILVLARFFGQILSRNFSIKCASSLYANGYLELMKFSGKSTGEMYPMDAIQET